MASTILNDYLTRNLQVEVETTEELTETEKKEVASLIQEAFMWCLVGESPPNFETIRYGIARTNLRLARKLIGGRYRYKRYCKND